MRSSKNYYLGWAAIVTGAAMPSIMVAQSKNTMRNPAIHIEPTSTQAEPQYCTDLAANFCPRIPYLKTVADRVQAFAPVLAEVLESANTVEPRRKLYEHLLTSLQRRGFPLHKNLDVQTLQDYFTAERDTYLSNGGGIAKIFKLDTNGCADESSRAANRASTLNLEIAKISALTTPAENNFAILRMGTKDDSKTLQDLARSMQGSMQARDLRETMGDYNVNSPESTEKFGRAYATFQSFYFGAIVTRVIESQRLLTSLKPKFQEFVYLCGLFSEPGELAGEESECDVSTLLEVAHVEDMAIATVNSQVSLDQKLVDLRRRLWNAYQDHLQRRPPSGLRDLRFAVQQLEDNGVRDEKSFSAVITRFSEFSPVVENVAEQLNPLFFEGNQAAMLDRMLCATRDELYQKGLGQELARVERVIQRSEPVVHVIQQGLMPEEGLKGLKSVFDTAIENSAAYFSTLSKFIDNPIDARRLESGFRNLTVYSPWNRRDVYMTDPYTSIKTLDFNKIPDGDFFYNLFVGGDFEALEKMNAYIFDEQMTQYGGHDGLVVLPAFYQSYEKNIGTKFFMLNHEIAHMFDPNVFKRMGTRFPPQLQSVMDCLSKVKSVGAQEHQRAECFADWFATEVLATTLSSMPTNEEKFSMAQDSLLFLCELHMSGVGPLNPKASTKFGQIDEHATPKKRINAIIGANPVVREALGCKATGKEPYCGLSGDAK